MDKKKLLISIVAGGLALVMLLTLVVSILPASAGAVTSDELKDQLDELQAKKDQISQQIADLEGQQSENLDSIQNILNQKAVLDQQIALLYAEVDNVNQQIAAYDLMIADKQADLEAAQARLAELNEKNKERIRAMEEEGELSYWSVLFQASDFSDLLDRLNMIQEIAAADRRRLDEMSAVAQEVLDAQQVLEEEKAALETMKAELVASQAVLDEKSVEAEALLLELVAVSEDLDALHEQFESEEDDFLNQLLDTEKQYYDKLEEESSIAASVQASIEASIQESIQESIWLEESIQASIQASIDASIAASEGEEGNGGDGEHGDDQDSNIDADGIRWIVPTNYSRISSPFGYRWHPVSGEWKMHNGVDMAAPEGTPIYATRSGYVTIASYDWAAGNYVKINHQDGFSSVYMHMTHYVVERGEYVKAGQVIGYVGTTGLSTGNHLHFGISYKGEYVNPMDYLD